ncbi:MAG: class I SAM-dependent methyltransferase [Rhodocyclales bacterium]|nr:class I SAM-dependent methyltransferase [Rhodocyclales bacterium]
MNTSEIAEYYAAERPELVAFLRRHGPFGAALDIGCAAGMLGAGLLRNGIVGACDGIELNDAAARLAETRLGQVWSGSLESVAEEIPWEQYDLIILADVLEHLVDPWATLRRLHAHSAPGCRLMLSVPNVRHYKVALPLLFRGEFRYTEQGIMDRTHLHFFTRGSLEETVRESGWTIRGLGSHMKGRYRRWYVPTRLVEPFVAVQTMLLAEKQ